MNRVLLGILVLALGSMVMVTEAEAKRVGGSRSVGMQRNVTPPPAPARPAQQAAPAQQNAAAAAPQAAPGGLSRWMPMLGGLAIGGLLGSMFGGGALGGILIFALLAIAAVVALRLFLRPRAASTPPLQFAGLGNETVAAPPPSQAAGFDAQAQGAPARIPAGFDVAAFLRGAKMNYIRIQLANDLGNLEEIREFTTPEMFETLRADVVARGAEGQQTDVVSLNADLLEVVTEGDTHWASVQFSGMIRETPGSAPTGFAEVWNLAKPADGSTGWVLAGIQQTH